MHLPCSCNLGPPTQNLGPPNQKGSWWTSYFWRPILVFILCNRCAVYVPHVPCTSHTCALWPPACFTTVQFISNMFDVFFWADLKCTMNRWCCTHAVLLWSLSRRSPFHLPSVCALLTDQWGRHGGGYGSTYFLLSELVIKPGCRGWRVKAKAEAANFLKLLGRHQEDQLCGNSTHILANQFVNKRFVFRLILKVLFIVSLPGHEVNSVISKTLQRREAAPHSQSSSDNITFLRVLQRSSFSQTNTINRFS